MKSQLDFRSEVATLAAAAATGSKLMVPARVRIWEVVPFTRVVDETYVTARPRNPGVKLN